jgi:hypothetical protein
MEVELAPKEMMAGQQIDRTEDSDCCPLNSRSHCSPFREDGAILLNRYAIVNLKPPGPTG